MHSKKMFSDNSCTTEGTVIRINPLILHGKNLRRAIQSSKNHLGHSSFGAYDLSFSVQ